MRHDSGEAALQLCAQVLFQLWILNKCPAVCANNDSFLSLHHHLYLSWSPLPSMHTISHTLNAKTVTEMSHQFHPTFTLHSILPFLLGCNASTACTQYNSSFLHTAIAKSPKLSPCVDGALFRSFSKAEASSSDAFLLKASFTFPTTPLIDLCHKTTPGRSSSSTEGFNVQPSHHYKNFRRPTNALN